MRARSFATARLSALLRGYALRFVTPTRPGPRFLESPDANGRTLSDASAAGTLQSDHAPDGTMPRPPASKSDELRPQEPLPLRQSRHRLTSLTPSEMDVFLAWIGLKSRENRIAVQPPALLIALQP